MTSRPVRLAGCLLAGLLAACTPAAPTDRPDLLTPAQFAAGGALPLGWPDPAWWRGFGTKELDGLVEEALRRNVDLTVGMARVRQADLQARVAGAALLPTVDASTGASRVRSASSRGSSNDSRVEDDFGLDLVASWELDLWGRNRANLDSALASAQAVRLDQEALALTVSASVAETYLRLLTQRDLIRIAQANLANARRVLALVETKVANGAVSELELAQQRTQVANQTAELPSLIQTERQLANALALLLGRPVAGFSVQGSTLAPIRLVPVVAGLPSELLQRRPDIAASEAALTAASADVVAARAALFPTISLTGRAGIGSDSLRSVLNQTSLVSIALNIVQPIFDGDRLRNQVAISEAQRIELLETYRGTALQAFAEVEDALDGSQQTSLRERALRTAVVEARRAFSLAEAQYRAGAIDLLDLLDAQRTLFSAESAVVSSRLSHLLSLVDLYRALGGGWDPAGR